MRCTFSGHASGVAGALACLLAAACGDSSAPPVVPAHLRVAQGDGQMGPGGAPLLRPVVFAVTDMDERPVPGVDVTLEVVAGGGSVPSGLATTGSDGAAVTNWTLGTEDAPQILEARAAGLQAVHATAALGPCEPAACPIAEPPVFDLLQPLALDTYEGSGQVVHPDVVTQLGTWRLPMWLAVTPYPGGDPHFENPSIFESANGRHWRVPEGLANPVALPGTGYLSDPDLVFDPDENRLRMYYRQVLGGTNDILLTRSDDGIHWSAPEHVVGAPSHRIVSPAVVRGSPAAPWTMFSVNSGPEGCTARSTVVERRTSEDGVRWSAPVATDLDLPGHVPWHLDVQWIPARGEYWALTNTYPAGGTCTTDALRLARSPDGLRWTVFPSPVLASGASDAFRDVVYRSTFVVDEAAETVTFWFSGASYATGKYVWQAATETRRVADLLRTVEAPRAEARLAARPGLPPPEAADMPAGHGPG